MCQYIEFCASHLMITVLQPQIYDGAANHPFGLDDIHLLSRKNKFLQKNVTVNTPTVALA